METMLLESGEADGWDMAFRAFSLVVRFMMELRSGLLETGLEVEFEGFR